MSPNETNGPAHRACTHAGHAFRSAALRPPTNTTRSTAAAPPCLARAREQPAWRVAFAHARALKPGLTNPACCDCSVARACDPPHLLCEAIDPCCLVFSGVLLQACRMQPHTEPTLSFGVPCCTLRSTSTLPGPHVLGTPAVGATSPNQPVEFALHKHEHPNHPPGRLLAAFAGELSRQQLLYSVCPLYLRAGDLLHAPL